MTGGYDRHRRLKLAAHGDTPSCARGKAIRAYGLTIFQRVFLSFYT